VNKETEGMSFLEHFSELRKRLIRASLGVLMGFFIAYHFAEEIFDWLLRPLCAAFKNSECRLITIGVAEAFLVYLKTGLLGGVFLGAPWVFYQIWKFVAPGLKPNERKYVLPFVISTSIMFVGGALFGFTYIFPFAFEFFFGEIRDPIIPMPAMSYYFSFASGLLIAFGILFEIPVIVVLFNLIGVLSSKSLWKTWRHAIIGIFILSAILTPADPFTMLLLGVPLSALYITSLVICSLIDRSRAKSSGV